MSCQKCQSERVANISAKCSDMCMTSVGKIKYHDYVPSDMGIGGGDYLEFKYCLNCGQVQGEWPLRTTNIEKEIPIHEVREFFENHFSPGDMVDDYKDSRIRLISSANSMSYKFGTWLQNFFGVNLSKQPSRRFRSAEWFQSMYTEGIVDLTEEW